MTPRFDDNGQTIYCGDNLAVLPTFAPNRFSTIITDPPYELGFMGKRWDSSGVAFQPETWEAVSRVAKPGAFLLAFGGTRTFHRLTCAIEDAGWEIRDCLMWLYGSGFPKSLNLDGDFDGWGTALKPAWEPIIVAMKPLDGTKATALSASSGSRKAFCSDRRANEHPTAPTHPCPALAARPEAHRRRDRRRHAWPGHRPRLPELPRVGPGVLSPRAGRAVDLRGVLAEAAAGGGSGSDEGETMSVISFKVDGLPKGQPRPRAFARKMGDRFVARVFDAGTAESWKSEIALAARPSLPPSPLGGPIEMRMEFYLPRPKRLCRRCDPTTRIPAVCKPDVDNLAKAVMDCLTVLRFWDGDEQVYALTVLKFYHAIGERPGASILIAFDRPPLASEPAETAELFEVQA
jgi:Holliday junction resolvase RusA-like endonuclease